MRRALTFVFALILALVGFYVAWPAWTAHQIRRAIETNDPAALAQRIDFASVRERAKPFIAAQVKRSLDQLQKQGGSLGSVLAGQMRDSLGGAMANAAVDAALTPENVIQFAREGKDISLILKDIASGGAKGAKSDGGSAPVTSAPDRESRPRRELTLANITNYRITGPFNIQVGVAHEPNAASPDVIADLAFTSGTWKVVGLVPQL